MSFRGTLTALRSGPMQNSLNSTGPSERSCVWFVALHRIETYHIVFIINRLGIILYKRNVFMSVKKTVDCGIKIT